MSGNVIKSVTPWHPIVKLQTLNSALRSLDSHLYTQAGYFMHLILLLDKLILNIAEKTALLIAIMSVSDRDNARDKWFLNEKLFYYKLQCEPIVE